jgi:serine/threonine protein phosphatase 1
MSKFFVVSDIHSFYTPLTKALDDAGFDSNNEEHWLVVCGDCFDRGSESEEVLHFLMSLERKILIKGNHDALLEECCMREFYYSHDISNGTRRTIQDLGGAGYGRPFDECCRITWNKLVGYRELLVNYFETKNYIFVHSWIPLIIEDDYPKYYTRDREYRFDPDWRNATEKEWEQAMWGNPFDIHFEGLNQTGKTIVFGHWHCSTGHKMLGHCKDEFDGDTIWEPCYAEGIIGIDRCTAYTGEVNVIVIEDEFLEGSGYDKQRIV